MKKQLFALHLILSKFRFKLIFALFVGCALIVLSEFLLFSLKDFFKLRNSIAVNFFIPNQRRKN